MICSVQIVKKYTEAKQNHHHEIETEVSSNDSESVECIDERSDNKVQNALMRDMPFCRYLMVDIEMTEMRGNTWRTPFSK